MRNCRITQLQHAKGYDPAGTAAVFIGGSDARIIIGPDEAALQCYGEKAGRWSHMTFRVTCWSSWGSASGEGAP